METCTKDREGYIYCITDGVDYKIGKTNNLRKRLAALSTGNKVNLSLVCAVLVHDMVLYETTIHRIFSANRINREWFRLNEKELLLLKKIFGIVPINEKEHNQLLSLGLEVKYNEQQS